MTSRISNNNNNSNSNNVPSHQTSTDGSTMPISALNPSAVSMTDDERMDLNAADAAVAAGARVSLVECLAGDADHVDADTLATVFSVASEGHAARVVAAQADQRQRDMARRMREEQDAEYEASLLRDRKRAQEQAEEKARLEAEAAAAAAVAAAEQTRLACRQNALDARQRLAFERLPVDPISSPPLGTTTTTTTTPPPASASSSAVTTVRLRLPGGTTASRRFRSDSPLQVVFDFVHTLPEVGSTLLVCHLVSSYPKRLFTPRDEQVTLADLGLAPQATLFVQPVAEEDEQKELDEIQAFWAAKGREAGGK